MPSPTAQKTSPARAPHAGKGSFIFDYEGYGHGAARYPDAAGILRPVILPPELIGEIAPCNLFNARGMLLVKAGALIAPAIAMSAHARSPAQTIRIFCAGEEAERISDFNPIAQLLDTGKALSAIDERITRNEHVSQDELIRLACDLHAIWSLDADACMGYARVHKFGRPSICHTLHVALIAAELAAANGMDRFQIINVIGGALTMNLAKLALHDEMSDSAAKPDEAQDIEIHSHPNDGVQLLERIGRFGKPWLDAVGAHHENIDGSGYPWSLKGSAIPLSARIVRLADTFAARLNWRKSRQPLHWNLQRTRSAPNFAQHIFGKDLQCLDQPLITQLTRVLGRFPPGSLVRISNGELAVVTRRIPGTEPPAAPGEVYSIRDIYGQLLPEPRRRRIGHGGYEIRNYANEECRRFLAYDWQKLWGYAE